MDNGEKKGIEKEFYGSHFSVVVVMLCLSASPIEVAPTGQMLQKMRLCGAREQNSMRHSGVGEYIRVQEW